MGVSVMDVSVGGDEEDWDEELHPTKKITVTAMTTGIRLPINRPIIVGS